MNARASVAGWPFAGLISRPAPGEHLARRRGLVAEIDQRGVLTVLDPGGGTAAVVIDFASALYGVDGYPIAREAIRPGARVEVVQEENGAGWVTLEVHLLSPA